MWRVAKYRLGAIVATAVGLVFLWLKLPSHARPIAEIPGVAAWAFLSWFLGKSGELKGWLRWLPVIIFCFGFLLLLVVEEYLIGNGPPAHELLARELAMAAVGLSMALFLSYRVAERSGVHALGRLAAAAVGSLAGLVAAMLMAKSLPAATGLAEKAVPLALLFVVLSMPVVWGIDPLGRLGRRLLARQRVAWLRNDQAKPHIPTSPSDVRLQRKNDFEKAVQIFPWLPASLTIVAAFVVEISLSALGNGPVTRHLVGVLLPFGAGAVVLLLYLQHAGSRARGVANVVSWRGYGEARVLNALELDSISSVLEYTGEIEGVPSLRISNAPFSLFIADIERLEAMDSMNEIRCPRLEDATTPASLLPSPSRFAAQTQEKLASIIPTNDSQATLATLRKMVPLRWGVQDFVAGDMATLNGNPCQFLKAAIDTTENTTQHYSTCRPIAPSALSTLPGEVILWDFAMATMQQALLAYLQSGKTTRDAVLAWSYYSDDTSNAWKEVFGEGTSLKKVAGEIVSAATERKKNDRLTYRSNDPVQIRSRMKSASCVFGAGSWIFGDWHGMEPDIWRYLPTKHPVAGAAELSLLVWVEALTAIGSSEVAGDAEFAFANAMVSQEGQVILANCWAYAALPMALYLGGNFSESLKTMIGASEGDAKQSEQILWETRYPQWKILKAMDEKRVEVLARGGNAKFAEACEAAWAGVREAVDLCPNPNPPRSK